MLSADRWNKFISNLLDSDIDRLENWLISKREDQQPVPQPATVDRKFTIEDLCIGVRAYNTLKNICYYGEHDEAFILTMAGFELVRHKNCGSKTVAQIIAALDFDKRRHNLWDGIRNREKIEELYVIELTRIRKIQQKAWAV